MNFRYVSTADNPADYITRGLNVKKFREKLSHWYEGTKWIRQKESSWCYHKLGCLSRVQIEQVRSSVNYVAEREAVATADVRMEKFSSLLKLISVSSLVFKYINRLRKRKMDLKLQANSYLIKTMQRQSFSVELDFLLDPEVKSMPKLVKNLNLFLDPKDIIQSRGRIERSKYQNKKSRILFYWGKGII